MGDCHLGALAGHCLILQEQHTQGEAHRTPDAVLSWRQPGVWWLGPANPLHTPLHPLPPSVGALDNAATPRPCLGNRALAALGLPPTRAGRSGTGHSGRGKVTVPGSRSSGAGLQAAGAPGLCSRRPTVGAFVMLRRTFGFLTFDPGPSSAALMPVSLSSRAALTGAT